ncbi:MAG: rod shape-determining protein MreC, partial [Xanthomonadales bacterium]|nr:rod shape-determining protein MreC [Xanthomonadales bacterium]
VVLMALDHRGAYITQIRGLAETVIEPLYHAVDLPARLVRNVTEFGRSQSHLRAENQRLSEALLEQAAAVQQLQALTEENRRLRALLEATEGRQFQFRFAELVQVTLDPFSHVVLIDRGKSDGVFVGQAVLDGNGVMGQVANVNVGFSRVLLISDPGHALPVQLARTGLRTVAYGTGSTGSLSLPNVPPQADVRPGDLLVTSGLGDRFPPGFPVAEVAHVERVVGAPFAEIRARPLAALDRGREVLLVVSLADEAEPAPEQLPAEGES